jgi:hypothetical protein
MKSKYILLIIVANLHAQNYVQVKNRYNDKRTVNKLLQKHKKEYFQIVIYNPSGETPEFTSIIFIKVKKTVTYMKLKDNKILQQGNIHNDSIFSYPYYLKTGVNISEDILKFVPPSICCNQIYYMDLKYKFYFENENIPGTYHPDKEKQSYRTDWAKIIMNEIQREIK